MTSPDVFLTWVRRRPFDKPLSKTRGVEAAAGLAGVSTETFFRWLSGAQNPRRSHLLLLEALIRDNRVFLTEKAESYARHCHEGQVRKYTGAPYVTHPESVVRLLSEYTDDPRLMAAGWLHDVMEDCGVRYEALEAEFGPYVASLVYLLTNDEEEIQKAGKVKYMSRKLAGLPPDALTVKLCDVLDNMTGTRARKQAETYREILERVMADKPRVWNGTHEALAGRILEVYGRKYF